MNEISAECGWVGWNGVGTFWIDGSWVVRLRHQLAINNSIQEYLSIGMETCMIALMECMFMNRGFCTVMAVER